MAKKTIFIRANRISLTRPSRTTIWAGTIDDLVNDVFGYTLECGNSWNHKVNRYPKSAKSLVTNLNKAAEASCRHYQDTYYDIATEDEIAAYKAAKGDNLRSSYTIPNAV